MEHIQHSDATSPGSFSIESAPIGSATTIETDDEESCNGETLSKLVGRGLGKHWSPVPDHINSDNQTVLSWGKNSHERKMIKGNGWKKGCLSGASSAYLKCKYFRYGCPYMERVSKNSTGEFRAEFSGKSSHTFMMHFVGLRDKQYKLS